MEVEGAEQQHNEDQNLQSQINQLQIDPPQLVDSNQGKNKDPIDCEAELPDNKNLIALLPDKQEPLKYELPAGHCQKAEQLRLEVGRKMAESSNDNRKKWNAINPQYTTTKSLSFQGERNAYNFWKSQVTNDAKDIFFALFPRQIVQSILKMLNNKMKDMYSDQDERALKKRMFKWEQIYEYYGIKILMGYNRMPDPEDYFNQELPFRNKICELIKEGRFKFLEANTNLTDELLIQVKYHSLKQETIEDKFKIDGEVYSYLTKKINKKFRRSHDAGQCLAVIKNNLFEAQDQKGKSIECILLMDVQIQYILAVRFCYRENISNTIFNMLDPYKHKNYKLYFQRELLNLEHVNILAEHFAIYSCGLLAKSPQDDKIEFTADLITNNVVMVLRLQKSDLGEFTMLASTADGFHRNTIEQYPAQSDMYRCLFSSATMNGAIYTEVQEIVIWNSYVAYKNIQKVNTSINFLEFRLLLAKQLLRARMKNIPDSSQTIQALQPRQSTIGINTDVMGHFSVEDMEILPKINFHVPCKCAPPKQLRNKLVCLVCRRPQTDLVECKSCSEVSGKLITLCGTECFSLFHQEPKKYVQTAEDIPVLQQAAQYDLSALGQSENYQKSYQNRQK